MRGFRRSDRADAGGPQAFCPLAGPVTLDLGYRYTPILVSEGTDCMAFVISFRTSRFDVSKETPNPINPIAGESVLNWLRPALASADYRSTEPGTEDWGWYMDVEGPGGAYLVGASADADGTMADVEWVVQVHRARSMKDKLLGRNELAAGDPLCSLIERLVRAEPQIEMLAVDVDG